MHSASTISCAYLFFLAEPIPVPYLLLNYLLNFFEVEKRYCSTACTNSAVSKSARMRSAGIMSYLYFYWWWVLLPLSWQSRHLSPFPPGWVSSEWAVEGLEWERANCWHYKKKNQAHGYIDTVWRSGSGGTADATSKCQKWIHTT